MTSLVDLSDRLSACSMSIRAAATPAMDNPMPGPFVHAVLHASLGDTIRDIDSSEIGLFTLVQPSQPVVPEAEPMNVEIARVEFLGATPLRKPPSSKHGNSGRGRTPREHEPEVYANAALKYLDRYDSIRPMPRASEQADRILSRLASIRESIRSLNELLQQHPDAEPEEPLQSPKTTIKEEEHEIAALQGRIRTLREQKEMLEKRRIRAPLKARRQSKAHAVGPAMSPSNEGEASFWNTPGNAPRTLHFTGESLMDEEVDLANTSIASFGTPVGRHKLTSKLQPDPQTPGNQQSDEDADDYEVDGALHFEETTEPTVILETSPETSLFPEPEEGSEETAPSALAQDLVEPTTTTPHSRQKIRVTTELERIVEKIWATVGELIMPGHPFDALGKSTNKSKPPRAKETLSYLRELASHSPTPVSPSASSFSSHTAPSGPNVAPTAQQVLTAHMLLALLGAPSMSLTLRALKETLSAKAVSVGADTGAALLGGSAVTKPLYGCVAKRLLKIERGAGEQVVKFDL